MNRRDNRTRAAGCLSAPSRTPAEARAVACGFVVASRHRKLTPAEERALGSAALDCFADVSLDPDPRGDFVAHAIRFLAQMAGERRLTWAEHHLLLDGIEAYFGPISPAEVTA